jgi:hypothetical protein
MTPTQHATAVADYIIRTQNPHLTEPLPSEQLRAEVHAILSRKAGTGSNYASADAYLSAAGVNMTKLHVAKLVAITAD